ncbi:restriction endonuclease subunit S [Streptomyces sp. NPDC088729]|uniref:restriction endonuclease subunit S n=1 Tax=Streptomyces sp. NPDC088729 TaxID=3365876 RepID=UPI0037F8ACDF
MTEATDISTTGTVSLGGAVPPAEWSWSPLGEVSLGVYDCPHSTPTLAEDGPYLVRTQDILSGAFRMAGAAKVSRETYLERIKRAEPAHGDLLYSREGTYFGIAAEVPQGEEVCLGQRMVLIRPNASVVNYRYLRYWLNSSFMASHVNGSKDGSVAARLNLPTIRKLPTLLPRLVEQEAIAATLGALDDKIAVNERIAATADELALTLASSERWEKRIRLGEIAALSKVQQVPQEMSDDLVDHYSLPAFDAGKAPERCSPLSIKSGKFVVDSPAVLLSKLNPEIPRVWDVVPDNSVPSLASTEFLVLVPGMELSTHDLWSVVAQRRFLEALASKVTGTSKSHQRVRPAEVMETEVVDPREFGEVGVQIRSLAQSILVARHESKTLATLRDMLLPQLMSGRIRVKDAEKIVEGHV